MRALARGFSHPFLDQLKKGSESLGAQEREQERELATKIPPYVSLSVVRAWLRLWRLLRGSVQMEFTLSLLCAQQVGKKLAMARGPSLTFCCWTCALCMSVIHTEPPGKHTPVFFG